MKISSSGKIRKVSLLSFLLYLLMILGPALSGGSSNSHDYSEFSIPYSVYLLTSFFFIFIVSGFIYNFTRHSLNNFIVLSLIVFYYYFSQLGNLIIYRETKFIFALIAVPAGIYITNIFTAQRIQKIIFNSSFLHGGIIIFIVFFGIFVPGIDLIFSENYLNKLDDENLTRSSGLFLNNNSLGSTYLLIMTFIFSTSNFHINRRILIIFIYSFILILAYNYTALFFILSYFFWLIIRNFFFSRKIDLIFLFCLIISVFLLIFYFIADMDFIYSKIHSSGFLKFNLFFETLGNINLNYIFLFFGGIPGYTESTLIDLIYYFGPLLAGLFFMILIVAFVRSLLLYVYSKTKNKFYIFYLSFLYLLLVQNSVFLPLNLFLFGIVLGFDLRYPVGRIQKCSATS